MTIIHRSFATLVSALLLAGASAAASADWKLQNDASTLSYLSTKIITGGAASVTERNAFRTLSGSVTDAGEARIVIDLASVETNIPIRNERMQKFVLNVAADSEAEITASVPASVLEAGTHHMKLPATLAFNGTSQALEIPVVVSTTDATVRVVATEPVMLQAADIGVTDGLKKLAELAGLAFIPTTIPVSFDLQFSR